MTAREYVSSTGYLLDVRLSDDRYETVQVDGTGEAANIETAQRIARSLRVDAHIPVSAAFLVGPALDGSSLYAVYVSHDDPEQTSYTWSSLSLSITSNVVGEEPYAQVGRQVNGHETRWHECVQTAENQPPNLPSTRPHPTGPCGWTVQILGGPDGAIIDVSSQATPGEPTLTLEQVYEMADRVVIPN